MYVPFLVLIISPFRITVSKVHLMTMALTHHDFMISFSVRYLSGHNLDPMWTEPTLKSKIICLRESSPLRRKSKLRNKCLKFFHSLIILAPGKIIQIVICSWCFIYSEVVSVHMCILILFKPWLLVFKGTY